MLSETVITLLMQIPLAGVVVFVVVVFLKHLEKADDRNQKFICDQQDSNNLILKNLANEIKEVGEKISDLNTSVGEKISNLNTTMVSHDVKTETLLGMGRATAKRQKEDDAKR